VNQADDDFREGNKIDVPREFKNGTATLTNVYAWSESFLGSGKPLQTRYEDIDLDGQDELLVSHVMRCTTFFRILRKILVIQQMPKAITQKD